MFKCFIPMAEVGNGIIDVIGEAAKNFGSSAMLIIDPFLDSKGLGDRIGILLKNADINMIKFTDIQPNPSCFSVDNAALIAREAKCEVILAVGGGSAIDLGKAVSILSINPGNSWEYTERSDHEIRRPAKTLPLIAVPTTSGTGSETTPFAVLNNTAIREKSTIVSDMIYAKKVLVDPEQMITMPRRLTASTGFDAFAHCLEAYISLASTPFSKMVAREGMRIITEYLPQAVANGKNLNAREKMAWGSLLGGTAIATIGVALPHSLGQPVGGYCNAPHGESVAACIVEVLKMSYLANPKVFAEITDILEPSYYTKSIKQRAAVCPEVIQSFIDDIGLRVRFRDFGLTEADIDKVTNIAMTGYYFDIQCHPLAVTELEIKELYRRCL